MGGPNHFKPQFIWKQIVNLVNMYCSFEEHYTAFSRNNVCLLVIFNSKTRYPKGAVQQMEVEIAALYNTMHINLQWTDRSRVWSWGYGFKYGWLICTVFCHCLQCQDIHLLWFLLPSVLPFSSQSLTNFYSKSGISEKEKRTLNLTSQQT